MFYRRVALFEPSRPETIPYSITTHLIPHDALGIACGDNAQTKNEYQGKDQIGFTSHYCSVTTEERTRERPERAAAAPS